MTEVDSTTWTFSPPYGDGIASSFDLYKLVQFSSPYGDGIGIFDRLAEMGVFSSPYGGGYGYWQIVRD